MDMDSTGNLLVGYYDTNKAKVTRNDNTDGTWNTTSGYPMELSGSSEDSINHYVKVVAMTSGKWLGMYCGVTGGHVYGRYWNGSTLASREQCTDVIASATSRFSACAYGDKVLLTWNGQPGNFSIYRRERSSGSWGTTTAIETMGSGDYNKLPACSVNKSNGDLYIFWQGYPTSQHLYYQKYTASTSTWESVTDAVTETTLANLYQIVPIQRAMNSCMLVFYLTGTTPFTIDNYYIASTTSEGGTPAVVHGGPSGGVASGAIMMI